MFIVRWINKKIIYFEKKTVIGFYYAIYFLGLGKISFSNSFVSFYSFVIKKNKNPPSMNR